MCKENNIFTNEELTIIYSCVVETMNNAREVAKKIRDEKSNNAIQEYILHLDEIASKLALIIK